MAQIKGYFSNIPADRFTSLSDKNLAIVENSSASSLIYRSGNKIYEIQARLVVEATDPSFSVATPITITNADSPYTSTSTAHDNLITVQTTLLNTISIYIPLISTAINSGFHIKKIGLGTVIVYPSLSGSDTIDDAASFKIRHKYHSYWFRPDSTAINWSVH